MTINIGFSPGRHALLCLGSVMAIPPASHDGFFTHITVD